MIIVAEEGRLDQMSVSGFTFVRDGIRLGYPFRESIRSLLPLCDEVVVNVGIGEDGTLEAVRELAAADDRLRIVESRWDPELRSGGHILAQQTNIALDACRHDVALYLQADEVLHEDDTPTILAGFAAMAHDARIEGLLLWYRHFYGSYHTIGTGRRWYRREVRAVRRSSGVRSWKDAQGFRIDGRKLRVLEVPAHVHHYGWVRPPALMRERKVDFEQWWSADKAVPVVVPDDWDYDPRIRVRPFAGRHPEVMADWIGRQDWPFEPDPRIWPWLRSQPREAVSAAFERWTGWRPGEYRNFVRVGRLAAQKETP
jgi:hypothetical protein